MKLSTGYDINLSNGSKTKINSLLGIGITSTSICDNVNFTAGIVMIFLIVGILLFAVSKIINKKQQSQFKN